MTVSSNHGEPVQTETPDIAAEQRARLRELFPEAFSEGRVDFEKLRAALGDLVDDGPERYRFTGAGKRDAIRLLQTPTGKPLLYLVRETKGPPDRDKWRPDERRKVACGERYFREALGVDYRVVVGAGELP